MGHQRSDSFFLLILMASPLFGGCSGLIYQPSSRLLVDPKQLGLKYEEVHFPTSDGVTLAGWFFPARLSTSEHLKGTIIQFHGNAENRSTHFLSLIWVIDEGYNLFTFDYRGYDGSEGTPSQEGTYRDGMAAIRYVKQNNAALNVPNLKENNAALNVPDLILYGQSLGGAILARCFEDVKDRSRVLSVVLDGSFYSYQAIARDVLSRSIITWPFQWLANAWVSDQYSPEKSFKKISPTPVLVIHGDSDPVIPVKFGETVFQLLGEPKTFFKVDRGKHLDTFQIDQQRYRKKVLEYWDKLRVAIR